MAAKMMREDGYVTPSDDPNSGGIIHIKAFIGHGEGVTVGDKIVLREGGPTGEVKCIAVANAANGEFGQNYPEPGIDIKTPVYYSEQKSGGSIKADIVWR